MTRHLGASRKVCFVALISTFPPLPSHSPFHLLSSSLLVRDQTLSLHYLLFPLLLFSTRQQSQCSILVSAWGWVGGNRKCGRDVCEDCALWPSSSPNKDTNSTMNHNVVQLWLVACLFLPLKDLPVHVPKDHILFIHSLFLPQSFFFFKSQHTEVSERMKR